MTSNRQDLIGCTVMIVLLCQGLTSILRAQESGGAAADSRAQVQAHAQPDIEKQKKEAEQRVEQSLDKEAIAAMEETRKAVQAIEQQEIDESLAAIERASGKINVLVGRNPAAALLPVAFEIEAIDTAPRDVKEIRRIVEAAEDAVEEKDYPAARVLLHGLTSELRVRTTHLPLATYPTAMRDAARRLDEKKVEEAKAILLTALNTLVVIDRVAPLPLAIARMAITDAELHREKDKEAAKRLLTVAKNELERGKELGYAGNDAEYAALDKAVEDIERQLNSNEDTASAFSKLKEKVTAFFRRQSESEKRSELSRSE